MKNGVGRLWRHNGKIWIGLADLHVNTSDAYEKVVEALWGLDPSPYPEELDWLLGAGAELPEEVKSRLEHFRHEPTTYHAPLRPNEISGNSDVGFFAWSCLRCRTYGTVKLHTPWVYGRFETSMYLDHAVCTHHNCRGVPCFSPSRTILDEPPPPHEVPTVTVPAVEWDRLKTIEAIVHRAVLCTGDDVCWMDLYRDLAGLTGVRFDPKLLGRERMLSNCICFVDSLLSGYPYVPDADARAAYDAIVAAGRPASAVAAFFEEHVPRLLGIPTPGGAACASCAGRSSTSSAAVCD